MTNPPVALITGGAKRVGRSIVEKMAASGYAICFTYRNSGCEANELETHLTRQNIPVLAVSADLSQPETAASQIFEAFRTKFSRLDLLVNNASIYQPSSLQTATLEQSRSMWAVHVEAPLLLCRHFEPLLRDARGHVVNMVDLLAERPWPEYLVYSASKGALATLTTGLARALAPDVTVNGVAPGVVAWPGDYPEENRQKYLQRVPLARAGNPEDVANLVHFLATSGDYITGQTIRLDGGRSGT
jgi:pteridine reductase